MKGAVMRRVCEWWRPTVPRARPRSARKGAGGWASGLRIQVARDVPRWPAHVVGALQARSQSVLKIGEKGASACVKRRDVPIISLLSSCSVLSLALLLTRSFRMHSVLE